MSKPADLRVYWSKRERALVYNGSKPTGGLTAHHLEMDEDAYSVCREHAARIAEFRKLVTP
jgi:hypothetical protein